MGTAIGEAACAKAVRWASGRSLQPSFAAAAAIDAAETPPAKCRRVIFRFMRCLVVRSSKDDVPVARRDEQRLLRGLRRVAELDRRALVARAHVGNRQWVREGFGVKSLGLVI